MHANLGRYICSTIYRCEKVKNVRLLLQILLIIVVYFLQLKFLHSAPEVIGSSEVAYYCQLLDLVQFPHQRLKPLSKPKVTALILLTATV